MKICIISDLHCKYRQDATELTETLLFSNLPRKPYTQHPVVSMLKAMFTVALPLFELAGNRLFKQWERDYVGGQRVRDDDGLLIRKDRLEKFFEQIRH